MYDKHLLWKFVILCDFELSVTTDTRSSLSELYLDEVESVSTCSLTVDFLAADTDSELEFLSGFGFGESGNVGFGTVVVSILLLLKT